MRKGLYLSSPHGRLIYDSQKNVIAVAKRVSIEGERVVCSKEDGKGYAYGIAVIGEPSLVDIETFDDRFSAHRVPRASRVKWWPDSTSLFLYPIRYFAPYPNPRPIEIPPGITMDMSSEVKFLDGEVSDPETPFGGDDSELVIMSSSDTIDVKGDEIMPWKPSDAQGHTKKADTPEKQELWAARANARLETCVKDGGDRKECEASAIRVANAAVAEKTKEYRSELPDSAFLYIEPGGKKVDGKTKPDSLRHLPYKNADGSLDLPRLRNAISRLGQPATGGGEDAWLTEPLRKRLQSKARSILEGARKKSVADLLVADDDEAGALAAIKATLVLDDLLILLEDDKAGDDGDGETHVCTCPNCDTEAEADLPCKETECPECGAKMRGGAEEDEEEKVVSVEEPEKPDEEEKKPEEKSEKAGRRFSNTILEKLRALGNSITELIQHGEYADQQPEPDPAEEIATRLSKGFKSLGVDSQGRTWFMIWPTNAYRDREREAFMTKALNDYVSRHVDRDVKGEAWFWHTDGSKFGTIREQAVVGDHFVCQLGTYDDTAVGNAFKQFFGKYPDSHPTIAPNGWGASHRYDYIWEDRKDGVYEYFDIQESTVLPLDIAANVYNPQPTMGGLKMNDQQKEAFEKVGEEVGVPNLVEQITAQANQAKEKLDAEGVERKELSQEAKTEESAPSEPKEEAPALDINETAKAIAEALQLGSLSKVLEELAASVKATNERLDAVESTVSQTEAEIKAKVAEEQIPRYAWFQASKAEETVNEEVKTSGNTPPLSPVVQGLVGLMERQA